MFLFPPPRIEKGEERETYYYSADRSIGFIFICAQYNQTAPPPFHQWSYCLMLSMITHAHKAGYRKRRDIFLCVNDLATMSTSIVIHRAFRLLLFSFFLLPDFKRFLISSTNVRRFSKRLKRIDPFQFIPFTPTVHPSSIGGGMKAGNRPSHPFV